MKDAKYDEGHNRDTVTLETAKLTPDILVMTITHTIRMFRATEGDLGNGIYPIADADDAEAVVQAKATLSAHFAGVKGSRNKPTQAVVSRLDPDGNETPFCRLGYLSENHVRETLLDVEPKGQIKRS